MIYQIVIKIKMKVTLSVKKVIKEIATKKSNKLKPLSFQWVLKK